MSVEGYRVTFQEIVDGVDPAGRGDKPFIKADPGGADIVITRLLPNGDKVVLVVVCDEDNSESRVYTLNNKTILTRYGSGNESAILIRDDDSDPDFPLQHDKTLFPNSIPIYMRAVDDVGNKEWLMLRHV